jgi:UDP-glucose 4-epimerase
VADPQRVLVTGGAGFIGSHLVDAFLERGCDVGVLDNLSSGRRANVAPAATLYEADISDSDAVTRVLGEARPQIVVHEAAHISVSESTRDPAGDAHANIIGTIVLLEACRKANVEHFVFASTGGALYGEPANVPAAETTLILPLSPYGAAKASIETYLKMYKGTWGLSYTALRYANVYGPRQTAEGEAGVIAIFAAKMLAGQSPTIFGTGEDLRDYVYVSDIVSANLLAVDHRLAGSYNVGTAVGTSVNRIADDLARLTGFQGDITHAPERAGDVRRSSLDATLLRTAAGWSPHVPLEKGLERVVEHFRSATP